MTTPIVQVTGLRKTYGLKVAVDDVSFAVHPGEIFGILGPNGAGKTTAVECIAGLRHADGGAITVLGVDPQAHPELVRENLGVQLQEAALHPRITVDEALELYASFYANPADIDELIDMLDLTEFRSRTFGKLSGGQKQRLSIALSLVGKPQIAILDELTTGLDPAARRATWALVDKVRASGVTILLVTHFMDEAERLCDRLAIIDGGRVVATGTPRELIDGLDDGRTLAVRPAVGDLQRTLETLAAMPALSVEPADTEVIVRGSRRVLFDVVHALAAADLVPDDVRTVSRNLEDVFLAVTGRTFDTTSPDPDPALNAAAASTPDLPAPASTSDTPGASK